MRKLRTFSSEPREKQQQTPSPPPPLRRSGKKKKKKQLGKSPLFTCPPPPLPEQCLFTGQVSPPLFRTKRALFSRQFAKPLFLFFFAARNLHCPKRKLLLSPRNKIISHHLRTQIPGKRINSVYSFPILPPSPTTGKSMCVVGLYKRSHQIHPSPPNLLRP